MAKKEVHESILPRVTWHIKYSRKPTVKEILIIEESVERIVEEESKTFNQKIATRINQEFTTLPVVDLLVEYHVTSEREEKIAEKFGDDNEA